jgi:hypothetical protein
VVARPPPLAAVVERPPPLAAVVERPPPLAAVVERPPPLATVVERPPTTAATQTTRTRSPESQPRTVTPSRSTVPSHRNAEPRPMSVSIDSQFNRRFRASVNRAHVLVFLPGLLQLILYAAY